jgi:chaperonin cofactor prefoldin
MRWYRFPEEKWADENARLRADVHRLINERAEECLAKEEARREVKRLRNRVNVLQAQLDDSAQQNERLRAALADAVSAFAELGADEYEAHFRHALEERR